MENVIITKMQSEIIASVVQLHLVTFEGYTNTLIGTPYVRAFFRWFCEADEAIALCAIESTKTPVGYIVGAPIGYTTSLNKRVFWPAVTGILLRPWLAFDSHLRWLVVNKLRSLTRNDKESVDDMPMLPRPTISLVGIGVHPEARGKRVGQELITAFESRVVEVNAKSMLLSVYPDKIAARKLYEKMGWQPFFRVDSQVMYYYKIVS